MTVYGWISARLIDGRCAELETLVGESWGLDTQHWFPIWRSPEKFETGLLAREAAQREVCLIRYVHVVGLDRSELFARFGDVPPNWRTAAETDIVARVYAYIEHGCVVRIENVRDYKSAIPGDAAESRVLVWESGFLPNSDEALEVGNKKTDELRKCAIDRPALNLFLGRATSSYFGEVWIRLQEQFAMAAAIQPESMFAGSVWVWGPGLNDMRCESFQQKAEALRPPGFLPGVRPEFEIFRVYGCETAGAACQDAEHWFLALTPAQRQANFEEAIKRVAEEQRNAMTIKSNTSPVQITDLVSTDDVPTHLDTAKGQLKALGGAAALGAGLAAIDQGGELLLDAAKHFLKDLPILEKLLADADGREMVKVIMALMLHTAASHSEILPKRDALKKVAELQVSVSSFKILGPRLADLRKLALALADIGEQLPAEAFESTPALFPAAAPAPTSNGTSRATIKHEG